MTYSTVLCVQMLLYDVKGRLNGVNLITYVLDATYRTLQGILLVDLNVLGQQFLHEPSSGMTKGFEGTMVQFFLCSNPIIVTQVVIMKPTHRTYLGFDVQPAPSL